eukprot:Gregarina_sp_Poly_1__7151@NODE_391_length_8961_cov_136_980886_g320_i0_p5_GENE_NODE_391_length_8961_cov_136_980886_g320_i0NODE_391_length_8961_cov_136_980886_g320_i0_p5_ORF_typecomplete_len129_score19_92DUF1449/PF07290_11/0_12PSII/PF00421_19/1_8PSII/PF00421_19/13PSII/PF00421_19/1_6e03PSII/PF00421_19/3_1e03_NODE_391_length_8961_cov_136_980886_g320_i063766762
MDLWGETVLSFSLGIIDFRGLTDFSICLVTMDLWGETVLSFSLGTSDFCGRTLLSIAVDDRGDTDGDRDMDGDALLNLSIFFGVSLVPSLRISLLCVFSLMAAFVAFFVILSVLPLLSSSIADSACFS